MSSSIRGHQGQFKIFENGSLTNIANITKVTTNQRSTFVDSTYVGNPIPELDQTIEGWEGTIDTEVKDDAIDQFIDGLINNNLAGIGVSEYTFISTENYSDGRSKSYVYFGCVFKMSKDQGGLKDKMTKRLDYQAAGRIAL